MTSPVDAPAPAPLDERAVVLAPVGRDAFVLCQTLAVGAISCVTSETLHDLIDRVREGVGMLLVTEEALHPAGLPDLLAVMAEQPPWSDLPIVVLLASEDAGAREASSVDALRLAHNVTVLQRPVAAITVLTAVQASLRARRRQYEVRELLVREQVAREHAEVAMRVKDEFLATVSHELRTPVSAILLWAKLLEAGRIDTEQAIIAVHAIATSAEGQSRLIEDLLDVSRMLMGKLRIDVRPCALGPIIEAAAEVVRPMAEAKGIRLDLRLEPDVVVPADGDRVQQIFWNLLSNAVKFTPPGGVVSVDLARGADGITTVVADTGEGIVPELLPHVFERFRQGDPGAGHRRGGLGLGLPIARQLVELHGGTIEAHSGGRGRGATFTVRLPPLKSGDQSSSGWTPSST